MNQKLLDQVAQRMAKYPIYSQEKAADVGEHVVVMRLFNAFGAGTWYLTEYDPIDKRAFGYVTGLGGDEWGYISVQELAEFKKHGLYPIEIDRHFESKKFKELKV